MTEINNRVIPTGGSDFDLPADPGTALRTFSPSFEGGVIAFGIGIGIYFALPFEPNWKGLGICAFAISLICLRLQPRWGILVLFGLVLGGLGRAAWHTDAVYTPRMPNYERSYVVTGWIKGIEPRTSPGHINGSQR